ncbi:MAG TPA: ABC transporter permease [Gemmatimonadales bacterium]|nr:ABC transporter permease [Gemmatimonadales bacterium]
MLHDFRLAIRSLRRTPGFTTVVVLTLALGIGANTAIFSVVNTVLLRSLPYPDADRLMTINEGRLPNLPDFAVSPANFHDYHDQNRSFSALAAYNEGDYTVTGEGEPVSLHGLEVSTEFFTVLGTGPVLGRAFTSEETAESAEPVVIVSHDLWLSRFGGAADVLSRSLTIDGKTFRIVGVMPAGFAFPQQGRLWLPLQLPADPNAQRGAHYLGVIGRRRPGVSLEAAQRDISAIAERLAAQYPRSNTGWSASAESLQDSMVGEVREGLLMLLGAVGLVVLIACANVANLLLARGARRSGEIAIRAALGADRARLVRLLLAESLLLSLLGGAVALLLAEPALGLIMRLAPRGIPRLEQLTLDGPMLGYTAGLVVLTALLFGLWPALQATRPHLNEMLQDAGRRGAGSRGGSRVRSALVVAEVALALTLLAGAGLLIRSFRELRHVDPGFDPAGVVTFDVSLPDGRYPDGARTSAFYDALLTRIQGLPGVRSAGAIFGLPLSNFGFSSSFEVEGAPVPLEQQPSIGMRLVSNDYFKTMGIPLKQGRLFEAADRRGGPPVVLLSESAARKFWPNGDAIGHRVTLGARPGPEKIQGEIVGIVGDVRAGRLAGPPSVLLYGSLAQVQVGFASVVVRSTGEPLEMMNGIKESVHALDPDLPVIGLAPLDEVVGQSVAQPRFYTALLSVFALIALMLAALGVFGVFSYLIAIRTREIGIRIALGAGRRDVITLVTGSAMRLVGLGVAIGLLAALGLSRVFRSMLFGVGPGDPSTLIAVTVLLAAVAYLASYLPADRATRLDPLVALRQE